MNWTTTTFGAIPPRRAALLVVLVSVGTFANSVPNGFAYDDNTVIGGRQLVTEGRVADALTSSYWDEYHQKRSAPRRDGT